MAKSIGWEKRIFKGKFAQYREVFDTGRKDPWQFNVIGFSPFGKHEFCSVEVVGGCTTSVPINDNNEILIAGEWFGRENWNH